MSRAAPPLDDADGIAELGRVLARAGYEAETVEALLTTREHPFVREPAAVPFQARLLPEGQPLATLVRLFLLGLPALRDDAAAALAPLPLERLAAAGLLLLDGERAVAAVDLVPVDGAVLATDRLAAGDAAPSADDVAAPSAATRCLAALTVRRPVEASLELSAGTGLHAVLAASHSGRAVARASSPRAEAFVRLNAVLNGRANVDARARDPAGGERFDLVVGDLGAAGEPAAGSSLAALLRELAGLLRDEGLAHVLVEWGHAADEDWSAPLRRSLEGAGCDALLLRYASDDALGHAAERSAHLRGDADAYGDALDRGAEACLRLGAERVAWGALVLRKRAGANWVWAHSPSRLPAQGASAHVERLLAAQDALARNGLLDAPLALADDHVLEQTVMLGGGGAALERATLQLEGGLGFRVALDRPALAVLAGLDGRRPVGAVAGAEDTPEIRRLLELGLLVPGSPGP